MFKIIAGCFKKRKKKVFSTKKGKQIRQASSFFQTVQGPILTATPVILSTFPSTLLQITLTLKIFLLDKLKMILRRKEFLCFISLTKTSRSVRKLGKIS